MTKKWKNHTFFWSPPPDGHFPKNVQKKLLASNTAQNSGPKIGCSKGVPFECLQKMTIFKNKHSFFHQKCNVSIKNKFLDFKSPKNCIICTLWAIFGFLGEYFGKRVKKCQNRLFLLFFRKMFFFMSPTKADVFFFSYYWIFMSSKYVLKVFLGFSKHFLKNEVGQLQIFKKKD